MGRRWYKQTKFVSNSKKAMKEVLKLQYEFQRLHRKEDTHFTKVPNKMLALTDTRSQQKHSHMSALHSNL